MTVKQFFSGYRQRLQAVYSPNEANIIAEWVFEAVTGLNKTALQTRWDMPLDATIVQVLETKLAELLAHRPVQYVVGEAWFYNMKWKVDENVLVPRPETEELVTMVMDNGGWRVENDEMPADVTGLSTVNRHPLSVSEPSVPDHRPSAIEPRILDIGTGSGCIAVTLQKMLPQAAVTAVDLSEGALAVAKQNAALHVAAVTFLQLDFLQKENWRLLGQYDAIVSNPPYIPIAEKELLDTNVVAYEPGMALFVPDNDPLVFYRAIAGFGLQHLKPNGFIAVETHERYAQQVAALFAGQYKNVAVKKDVFGKERMVVAK
jgi:release factor glutamine methyltransferase